MQIGDIVSALMKEEDLTLEAVAARVRAAGNPKVRYQHIQQLIEIPTRQPRYLPQLAQAFGMTVEQFLSWKPGTKRPSLPAPGEEVRGSQVMGQDPEILASSYQLVRLACVALGTNFDPETAEDARIVLLAYEYLLVRMQRKVTPDNLVDFTAYLRKRGESQGNADEGTRGAGGARASAG